MKRLGVVLLVVLLSSFLISREKRTVVLFSPEQNVLYVGVDNLLHINSKERVRLECDGAKIEPGKRKGTYVVTAKKSGIVNIVAWSKEDVELGTTTFTCRGIPSPTVNVSGKYGGEIEADALKSLSYLKARVSRFPYPIRTQVVEYSMTLIKEGVAEEFETTGNLINPKMKEKLETLTEGDRIIFESIQIETQEGDVVNGSPIAFKVI